MRAAPIDVVLGVHLDDVRTQVGQHPPCERAGDTETQVDHPHPGQRVRQGRPRARRSRRRRHGGFGQHLGRVLAATRRGRPHRARRVGELQQWPAMADRAHLGIDDLDDTPVGEERFVGQRLGGRADERHAHP